MGLEQAELGVQQAVRQGKITLARLTPSKRAEAANIGVSDTTFGRWCDVSRINENMPWSLLSKHSAANELLSYLAEELGLTLVKTIEAGELNGELGDESQQLLILLGKFAEKHRQFMNDRKSPGPIKGGEAYDLMPIAKGLARASATMVAELQKILAGDR